MKSKFNRYCKMTVGWALVSLGIIGWLLPILPGTPFIVLGLAILSAESEWLRNKIEALKMRFPRQTARLQLLKESLAAKLRKMGAS